MPDPPCGRERKAAGGHAACREHPVLFDGEVKAAGCPGLTVSGFNVDRRHWVSEINTSTEQG